MKDWKTGRLEDWKTHSSIQTGQSSGLVIAEDRRNSALLFYVIFLRFTAFVGFSPAVVHSSSPSLGPPIEPDRPLQPRNTLTIRPEYLRYLGYRDSLLSVSMAQILTPPASRHTSESPEIQQKENELSQTLDTLLERYLALLDRHQKLQADLAKQLSSVRSRITKPPP